MYEEVAIFTYGEIALAPACNIVQFSGVGSAPTLSRFPGNGRVSQLQVQLIIFLRTSRFNLSVVGIDAPRNSFCTLKPNIYLGISAT
jgi:hypothetical protein